MSVRVTIKDTGAKELFARLQQLKGLTVTVGFQGTEGSAPHPLAGITVAMVAMFNEFGTINAPARPFLRSAIIEGKAQITRAFAAEYKKVVDGTRSPVEASGNVGKVMAELVRKRIEKANAWATPNAPSTIEKKGHSKVLRGGDPKKNVAPGTMLESVTWEVRRGSSVLARGK